MKRLLAVAVLAVPMFAFGAGKACKFSDAAKLKEHLTTHVTYPTTGKDVKAACKKEIPDEFPKEERACFEGKLKDGTQYKDVGEVLKAVGIEG